MLPEGFGGRKRRVPSMGVPFETRALMVEQIAKLFQGRSNYSGKVPIAKLAGFLEENLFMEAASEREYMDKNTLNLRLQNLIHRTIAQRRASQSSHRVPEHQVRPDASYLPLHPPLDHFLGCTAVPLGNHYTRFFGRGPSADGYPRGQYPFFTSVHNERQPFLDVALDPLVSIEETTCHSICWGNGLNTGACNGAVSYPWGNPLDSCEASFNDHSLAQKYLHCHSLLPLAPVEQSGRQCCNTDQRINPELPSNQFCPPNFVSLKGSSTFSSSRVSAVSNVSHPCGAQWGDCQDQRSFSQSVESNRSVLGQPEVMPPAPKRLRKDGKFGHSPSQCEIPRGKRFPEWQKCPESPVCIDSQYPSMQSSVTAIGLFPDVNGVSGNLVKDSSEGNNKDNVTPLEEIFATRTSKMGDTDDIMVEAEADSCSRGSGGIVSIEDPTVGCGDGEQVMGDAPKGSYSWACGSMVSTNEPSRGCEDGKQVTVDPPELNLDTVHSTSEMVTVSPNMDNIDLVKQREALVDSSGLSSDRVHLRSEDPNPCCEGERQLTELSNKGYESQGVLSESIHKEVSGGREATGVSMIENMTREQIEKHLSGLKRPGSQILPLDGEMDAAHSQSDTPCKLCGERGLFFPGSISCSSCYRIIKHGSNYYTLEEEGELLDGEGEKLCFCSRKCGAKSKMVKKIYDDRIMEPWVQCNRCEDWCHQICGLYNKEKDVENAEYICPSCLLEEMDSSDGTTFRGGCSVSAKDLPRTLLSDRIEQRLYGCLKQEREDRAKASGKNVHEVPSAEGLVVRVVSSLTKKVEVNKQFLDIFHHENYPSELPYKSKVIALFQEIEGVDVFLFGIYVQEYGTDCSSPNSRKVYISYLDSVQYFRPDVKSAYGGNLRTYVYHEILIGYLEYCKKRGFVSCYLWVCPPVKGDDFLFYCHPESQKNLSAEFLRTWYRKMFLKATNEKIVLSSTTLYKCHLVPPKRGKFKSTAARLPYFEGDYWPNQLDNILAEMNKKPVKKVEAKDSTISKRALKGLENLSADVGRDILDQFEQGMVNLLNNRKDFMVAHLQCICTSCQEAILSGKRWVCTHCKNFQLCQRCVVDSEEAGSTGKSSPVCQKNHLLSEETIDYVSEGTQDEDIIIENPLFEKRATFLEICKMNHYQFDTLRRAKYSTMMILQHGRRDPIAGSTCSFCQGEIFGPSKMCKICSEFRVCRECYTRQNFSHCHELTSASSAVDSQPETQFKQLGSLNLKDVLGLVVHCSQCNASKSQPCPYRYCSKIKGLFHHSTHCSLGGASKGCKHCQKVWHLLQLHAKGCKASGCKVPLCRRLKAQLGMPLLKPEHMDKGIRQTSIAA